MDNVDVRLLRAFLALMTERSVTRAAHRMGVGQSAMSQTLSRLRELFADPLLLKSRGGMTVTDRALELEKSVRLMLDEYDRMLAPADRFDPASSRRRFVVTAPEYAEHLLMPSVFARLRQDAPGIRIEVHAPQPSRIAELLERGEIDLRVAWVLTAPPSLRSLQLFQDRIVCLASATHPTIRGRLTLDQFLEWPHVQPLGTGRPTTAVVLADAVAREGRKIERAFLVQNFLTIPAIVARTDMLATLPETLARAFATQHGLQVLDLPLRLPRIRYAAYWHERSQKDPGHRWLRSVFSEAARGLAGS